MDITREVTMDLFALCPKCELPVIGVLVHPINCPFCSAPIDEKSVTKDYAFAFINELRHQSYFEWDDIQNLILRS